MPLILAGCISAYAALLAIAIHWSLHGARTGITPLGLFLGGWITTTGLYLWNPLDFEQLTLTTWLVVLLGVGSVVCGYAVVVVAVRSMGLSFRRGSAPIQLAANESRTARLLLISLLAAGAPLLLLFLSEVRFSTQLDRLGSSLFDLRVALNEGDVPIGFYFFYFFEPAVPLATLLAVGSRGRQRRIYLCVAVGAALPLVLTSARTNILFTALWTVTAVLLVATPRRASFTRRTAKSWRRRRVLLVATSVCTAVLVFTALGDAIGKSYENSELFTRYGADPPIPRVLSLPYLYVTAPLPTLEEVLDDDERVSPNPALRPAYQLLRVVFPDTEVPDHVQEFRRTPYLFNTSTYLGPSYQGGGLLQVVVVSLVLGVLGAWSYVKFRRRSSILRTMMCAFVAVTLVRTTGDLALPNLSWIFQFALLLIALRVEGGSHRAQRVGGLGQNSHLLPTRTR